MFTSPSVEKCARWLNFLDMREMHVHANAQQSMPNVIRIVRQSAPRKQFKDAERDIHAFSVRRRLRCAPRTALIGAQVGSEFNIICTCVRCVYVVDKSLHNG